MNASTTGLEVLTIKALRRMGRKACGEALFEIADELKRRGVGFRKKKRKKRG